MPGFELWSDKERKEVNDVLETGILMRYGLTDQEKVYGKPKSWRLPFARPLGVNMRSLRPVAQLP